MKNLHTNLMLLGFTVCFASFMIIALLGSKVFLIFLFSILIFLSFKKQKKFTAKKSFIYCRNCWRGEWHAVFIPEKIRLFLRTITFGGFVFVEPVKCKMCKTKRVRGFIPNEDGLYKAHLRALRKNKLF